MIIYSWQSNKIDKNFNRLYNDHQNNNDTGYPFKLLNKEYQKKNPALNHRNKLFSMWKLINVQLMFVYDICYKVYNAQWHCNKR